MAKVKKGTICLNCESEIGAANYCSNCGQINDTRHLTFGQLISESLANVLAFDGRFFKTFWNVISKPGAVARHFTQGKRVRYMNPVRFYFLSSLLIIFAIQYHNNRSYNLKADPGLKESDSSNLEIDKAKDKLDQREAFNELLINAENEIAKANSFKKTEFMLSYLKFKPQADAQEVLSALRLEETFYHKFLFSQSQKIYSFDNNKDENYESFNRAFLNKLFWILFFYIPILGLLLKLIYIRRKINYPEHLFFAFYQQAFFFQLLFIYVIFNLSGTYLGLIIFIYAIHLLLALKNFYGQRWGKTIFKFFLTNFLSIVSFMLFFILSALVVFVTL